MFNNKRRMSSIEKKIIVLDGGFSTQSSFYVDHEIDGDPLWTARLLATSPNAVISTHLDFLRAGAEIIQTNTYQASIEGFVKYLDINKNESLQLIYKAVDLAEEAINIYLKENNDNNNIKNLRPLIAGSCGPYGASLHDGSEYTGEYAKCVSKELLKNWHKIRIDALIKRGVDLLALETIPCEIEAIALIELLKDDYPNIKAWLSFSCKNDGKCIVDGSNFQNVARYCYENSIPGQIIAVGINCIAPSIVTSFFKGINDDKNKQIIPLIVYPNSGETYTVATGWQKFGTEPPIDGFVHEWLDLGVKFIGGCCRTYAKDIIKIKEKVQTWKKQ